MEDPMEENKDDNFGSMVEIERKKNKIKLTRARWGDRIFGSRNKGNVNK